MWPLGRETASPQQRPPADTPPVVAQEAEPVSSSPTAPPLRPAHGTKTPTHQSLSAPTPLPTEWTAPRLLPRDETVGEAGGRSAQAGAHNSVDLGALYERGGGRAQCVEGRDVKCTYSTVQTQAQCAQAGEGRRRPRPWRPVASRWALKNRQENKIYFAVRVNQSAPTTIKGRRGTALPRSTPRPPPRPLPPASPPRSCPAWGSQSASP